MCYFNIIYKINNNTHLFIYDLFITKYKYVHERSILK